MMSGERQANKQELVIAVAILLLLPLLAEVVLRLCGVEFQAQFYVADAVRGWGLRHSAEGLVLQETRMRVRVNSSGYHDRERTLQKPPNTVRIAVLGASWTEAFQVPLEATFSSVMEKKLDHSPCSGGRAVEVLNFGTAGYNTGQELLTLQNDVRAYHPDVVILAFYSARDVTNNLRELNSKGDAASAPYFVLRDGQLVSDGLYKRPKASKIAIQEMRMRIMDHLRVLEAVDTAVQWGRVQVAKSALKEQAKGTDSGNDIEFEVFKAPSTEQLKRAWAVTEAMLLAMRDEAHKQGAEFRIVSLATRPQVIPNLSQRVAIMKTLGVSDLSYADARITALGQREGIPVLPLAPALSAYAEAHQQYLNGFDETNFGKGHWNVTGHQVAAATIVDDLCQQHPDGSGTELRQVAIRQQEHDSR